MNKTLLCPRKGISIHKFKCVKCTDLKTSIISLDSFQSENPEPESPEVESKGQEKGTWSKHLTTKLVTQLLTLDRVRGKIVIMNKGVIHGPRCLYDLGILMCLTS